MFTLFPSLQNVMELTIRLSSCISEDRIDFFLFLFTFSIGCSNNLGEV